ncbi:mechanosensitive ion channel, partial [Leptolyngbya sp. FACHB-36]|uniref:mechanosensitive ion channel n=1 Tax=Leptolyngbya sp. FACHB-36 TaxID=2692808 RepID=UPI001680D512
MSVTWQVITQPFNFGVWTGIHLFLAQASPAPANPQQAIQESARESVDYVQDLSGRVIAFLPNLIGAVLVLLLGLLIAAIVSGIVRGILKRTNIDNRIAAGVAGHRDTTDLPKVEDLVANIVFWVIVLFTVVAVLQTLQLPAVAGPLNQFLNGIIGFLPNLVGAALLAGVAWVVATIVKLITTRGLQAVRFDERLGQRPDPLPDTVSAANTTPGPDLRTNRVSLSETIGNVLYWFIFLLFLLPILDTLNLNQALQPVQDLINRIVLSIPNILMALLIGAGGWFLANIVRQIVTNFLAASGADRLGAQFGLRSTRGGQSLSSILGTLVYVLILIPTAISALQALNIRAISDPAVSMLNQVFSTLPQIFTAALILILGYVAGKFVADLVTSILGSLGFDNIFNWLGIQTAPYAPTPPPSVSQSTTFQTGETVLQPDVPRSVTKTRSPSEIVGIIVLVG